MTRRLAIVTLAPLGALLAVLPAQAQPAASPGSKAQVAIPASDPGEWVTFKDYPDQAMQDDRGGTVSFKLVIRPDGTVQSCKVTESSGSADLDAEACRLLMLRGRFHPARNAQGVAVQGEYASRVRWSKGYQATNIQYLFVKRLEPTERVLTYTVDVDGSIHSCSETLNGQPVALPQTQSPCSFQGKTKPYLDASGTPVRKVVTQRYTVDLADPPKPPVDGPGGR